MYAARLLLSRPGCCCAAVKARLLSMGSRGIGPRQLLLPLAHEGALGCAEWGRRQQVRPVLKGATQRLQPSPPGYRAMVAGEQDRRDLPATIDRRPRVLRILQQARGVRFFAA